MRLSPARITSTTTASIVMLSLLAMPDVSLAQSADEPETGSSTAPDTLAAWRQRNELAELRLGAIREEESRNGPYSEALIDELVALGMLYQEGGRHDLAAESFERALQVKRANDGLNTFEQVPLLQLLIESERNSGDFEAVQRLEGRLIRLARSNPDDVRTVPILRDAGDRQFSIYTRYLNRELPPEINIGISFAGPGSRGRFSGNRGLAALALGQARASYRQAIGVMLRAEVYGSEELRDLESTLLNTYYLELTADDLSPGRKEALYMMGRDSLRRLVVYSAFNSGEAVDFAKALVELADWDLLFSRNGRALVQYREAYELLAEHDESGRLLEELFAPETPVALPVFAPNPLVSDDAQPSVGHVDVAFDVSRYGVSRRVAVLDAAGDRDAIPDERDAVRFIARNRFRPVLVDSEGPRRTSFVVRYHY